MTVDYPGAIDMMLPLSYSFTSNAHKAIVQHSTGGNMTVQSIYNTFLATMRSAHFGIGLDGTVAQFVPLARGAGSNCCADSTHNAWWNPLIAEYPNLNLCTISIEHCNDGSQSLLMTSAQMEASNKLTLWLCQQYGLGPGDIWGHDSIDATNCPGSVFYHSYWEQMITYIKNGGETVTVIDLSMPGVSAHFSAVPGNSNMWKCIQTGKIVGNAILAAYQKYGNSALCGLTYLGLPTSDEIAIDPVKYPHAVKQYFERGCLVYDPNKLVDNPPGSGSVYPAHLYNGGVGTDPALTQLQGVYAAIYAAYQALKQQQGNPQVLTDMQQIAANVEAMYPIALKYRAIS